MRGVLIRSSDDGIQTLGNLIVFDGEKIVFKCKTLELAWHDNAKGASCIPNGVYQVIKRYSEKHKDHYQISNVPDRDFILIHKGNFNYEIRGCVLVGLEHTDINGDGRKDVTASRIVMEQMLKSVGEFELTIISIF